MSTYASAYRDLDWLVSRTCESGACVGIARQDDLVLIRNTSRPEGPICEFTADEWRKFLDGAKLGDFDGIA
jgi:Domain of unknown function (DUF397)